MSAKELFKEIAKLENQIKSKRYMAQSYREFANGLQSPRYSDMPKNSNRALQPMADALNKAMDLEEEVLQLECTLQLQKAKAMDIINQIQNTELQIVLIKRYFEKSDWGKIMLSMHYSRSGIYKIHDRAIAEFDAILLKVDTSVHE
ncbi:TPA: hypothetical protein U2D36_000806 [Streptococcus suis]|nr:hypothetical protein [Streptococcus suis]HEM6178993.1 hypothetical protein [Streptococcus suis]HEM6356424.1 hypothetical protein [Streptococcus suis]HEM6380558.1 hypothetical protein [Streptococcus suis]HEM6409778.1 hypothetical protein [Streptococcus suis]